MSLFWFSHCDEAPDGLRGTASLPASIAYAPGPTDLDGNPRIARNLSRGTVLRQPETRSKSVIQSWFVCA